MEPPLPCSLMGRPESPRPMGGPPSLDNTFGEVGHDVAAAGTKRGAAVLARAPSISWAVSTLWPSSAGSHRRALAEAHRMLEVRLRCSTHGQCGIDGRGQDQLFSNFKGIAGVGENLRVDASFRWPGSVRNLLRCGLGGGAAQFPIRKVGSTIGGNIGRAAMARGCKKKDIAEWN